MLRFCVILFLLGVLVLSSADGLKVLGIFHMPGKSHYLAGSTLIKILAEKGHDVTMVSPFREKNLPKNYRQVVLDGIFEEIEAHKNLKLLITNEGIFSTYEAVYHGVPLLSLGVVPEQILNGKRSEKNGYAKAVPFFDMEEETLELYLKELLENPTYKENAERRSRILKDKPQPATEAVNYWVEYVVRHKGASHLRVASLDLAWYQYMLLDVFAFLLFSFAVSIYMLKMLFKTVFGRKVNKKEKTS